MNRKRTLIGILALGLVSLSGSLRGSGATTSPVTTAEEPSMGRPENPEELEGPVAPRVPRGDSPSGYIPALNDQPVGRDARTDLGAPGPNELNDLERAKLDLARRAIEAAEAAGTRTLLVLEVAPSQLDARDAEAMKLDELRSRAPEPLDTPIGLREDGPAAEKGGRP